MTSAPSPESLSTGAVIVMLERLLAEGNFKGVEHVLNMPDVDWRTATLILASVNAGLTVEDWERAGEVEQLKEMWSL